MELIRELIDDLPTLSQLGHATVRMLTAALLGGLIGLQREFVGTAAGLRTHMLVSLGSAFFVIVAVDIGMPVADLSRVIQGVATGIGFIGAGTILKLSREHEIRGLTTAASLWVTAALGVAVGLGRIGIAVAGTVLTWIVLAVFGYLSHRIGPRRPHDTESDV
ncbi:MAG TPA: MgtC/SapB family protein [Burkholderiaceae bacterium]|nr:MgtC/SapB family protein [Burkholderiaceae bacterium]